MQTTRSQRAMLAIREGDIIYRAAFAGSSQTKVGRADLESFEVPYQRWMRVLDALN